MIQEFSEWLRAVWAYVNYVYVWFRDGIRGDVCERDVMRISI